MKFEGYLYNIIDSRDSDSVDNLVASTDGSSASADNPAASTDGSSASAGIPAASTDGAYAFRISLRLDSPIYAGHFPGFPITPGVALLTIVRELLERHLHTSLTLTSADDVKFLHPLTPAHNPVTITFKECHNNTVKAEITTSTALHARMKLSYCLKIRT